MPIEKRPEQQRYVVFRITVERSFTASHQLTLPDGTMEPLHSHEWLMRADVSAEKLDSMGLVLDFKKLSAILDEAASGFVGKRLEDLAVFAGRNASAENIAEFIYRQAQPKLDARVRLDSVAVMETPGCWARYSEC